jgi:hypothetical protein
VHDINQRYTNAVDNKKTLHWIIDCSNTIEVNELGSIYMIYFYDNFWKYENFKNQPFIYLDYEDKIYKINPDQVKSHMIDVKEYQDKKVFIDNIKNNRNVWKDEVIPQCLIYHNQRGAGCGKTYESIQLINNNDKFKHKTNFIFLTKAHSAKEVIYNELKEQYDRGILESIEIDHEDVLNKQYKIRYNNTTLNTECNILIGT